MFIKILNFISLAQQPQDVDPIDAIKNLWPILIFIALSALSGFIKRKRDKSKTLTPKPKTPATTPPTIQARRLPSYARKLTQAGQSQPSPTRPVSADKIPTLTPRPVIQKPPSPTRLPPPTMPQKPRPTPAPPPLAPPKTAPTPIATWEKLRPPKIKTRTTPTTAARKQMFSTAEAAELRQTARRSEAPTSHRSSTASYPLQLTLERHEVLVRAILYAEIIDKPMALRPFGSHQF